MPPSEAVDDLILVACDDVYFRKFGLSLLSSMQRDGDMPALHIHLLNPSEETIEHAALLRERHKRLSFTTDDCRDSHPSSNISFYYTAARFILAPILLR
ncbi:hypothetical protein C8J36_1063 [Rhizobium sp. PP-F2F-G48]|nr:hypothetical protein C8J36_1063 [Rhizobium sp. PP-F2F-G48]